MLDFTGKNIVFVGGLGGIGYETSKLFMQQNIAYLAILDFIENTKALQVLQSLNTKCKLLYIKIDVTDKESIKSAINSVVTEMKYIDILVNGAGIFADRKVELTININLLGLINTTFEALPYMDKQQHGRGGVIVNIASVLGLEPGNIACVYSASKFGVVGFSRSLADPFYYNLTGVSVIIICPGFTETPLKQSIFTDNDTFTYSKPLTDQIRNAVSQTADICAEHILKAIKTNKNGSIWISDCGALKEAEPKKFWEPTFKN